MTIIILSEVPRWLPFELGCRATRARTAGEDAGGERDRKNVLMPIASPVVFGQNVNSFGPRKRREILR
jgi:hypothetical protein